MWFFFIMVYHAISPYGWQFFNTALNVHWLFFEIADMLLYWLTIFVSLCGYWEFVSLCACACVCLCLLACVGECMPVCTRSLSSVLPLCVFFCACVRVCVYLCLLGVCTLHACLCVCIHIHFCRFEYQSGRTDHTSERHDTRHVLFSGAKKRFCIYSRAKNSTKWSQESALPQGVLRNDWPARSREQDTARRSRTKKFLTEPRHCPVSADLSVCKRLCLVVLDDVCVYTL